MDLTACSSVATGGPRRTGPTVWKLAPFMAVFNFAGAALGARMALKRGSGFVRVVMLVVVVALVGKLAHDQWWGS